MATIKALNSIGGFSVGDTPSNIILANGDIVTSNLSVSGISNLGLIGNVIILGGVANQIISTDGNGHLSFVNPVSTTIANGSSNVSIPIANGNILLSVNGTPNVMVVSNAQVGILGNLVVGNSTSNTLVVNNNNVLINTANVGVNSNNVSFTSNTISFTSNNVNVTSNLKVSAGSSNLIINGNGISANGNISITSGSTNVQIGNGNVNVVSNLNVTGETLLTGNLTVTGNLTYVNVDTLDITDPIIQLGGGPNGTPLASNDGKDRGTLLQYYTTSPVSAFMGWKNSEGNFIFGSNVTDLNSVITVNTYGNVVANSFLGNIGGNTVNANYINVTANLVSNNITVNSQLSGNTANFTGNLTSLNANLGNLLHANYVNVSSNLYVGSDISGNTANFVGNISAANANIGNTVQANNANVTSNLSVGLNLLGNTANFTGNIIAGNANVGNTVQANNANVTSNLSVGLNLSGNTANFAGNLKTLNANLGNLTQANFVNVSSNITSNNITVNAQLSGNTANFTSNIVAGNANLGNLAQSNNITVSSNLNVGQILSGNTANFSGNLVTRNANLGNLVNVNYANITYDTNIFGNLNSGNANLGNYLTVNFANIADDLYVNNLVQANFIRADSNLYVGLNLFGNAANFTGNLVTLSNLYTDNIIGVTSGVTIKATGVDQNINLIPTGVGNVDVFAHRISNLAPPTNDFDAATKLYVDTLAQGLYPVASSQAATDNTLAFYSGGTVSYIQPGPEGINAILQTTGTYTLIDGVDVTTAGTRILVKNELDPAWNGIYTYTNSTTLTRATDYDTSATMRRSSYTFVSGGTVNLNTSWVQISEVITVGNDPVIFTEFSTAGHYTAGTGLTLTAGVFSVNNAQPQVTQVGTLSQLVVSGNVTVGNLGSTGNLTTTGNITAGYLFGNASQLIGISTDKIYNGSSNVSIPVVNGNIITSVNGTSNVLVISNNSANLKGNITTTGNATFNYNSDSQVTISNLATACVGYFDTAITFGLLGRNQPGNANIDFHTATSLISYDARISASGGNATVGSGNINVFAYNTTFSGNTTANNIQANQIFVGNTIIFSATTTTATTNKTTIAQYVLTGTDIVGIEFFVKSHDSSGAKYSMSKVHAVTDGTNVDYTTFGTVTLGSDTGILSVSTATGSIALQVVPTSSNSTVWTTQYRLI